MPHSFPLISPINVFRVSALDNLLWPYQYLDISAIYGAYSGLIDFFIYVLIFVGAAQVTLGQRFPGSGGKAVSVGSGLILAVGMIVLEERLGFSIKSFGPLAAGIVMLLLGLMIFRLLHHSGLAAHKAGAITYLAIFVFLAAVTPTLFDWLRTQAPLIGLLLMLLFLLSIAGAVSAAWPSGIGGGNFEARLRETERTDPGAQRSQRALRGEARFIKRGIRPIGKRAVKDSGAILRDLNQIRGAVARYGHNPQARRLIVEQLGKVLPRQHQLRSHIQALKNLNGQVMRLDASLYSAKSQRQLGGMNSQQKTLLQTELRDEAQKLGIEQKIEQIEASHERYAQDIEQYLNQTARLLQAGQDRDALSALDKAIAAEQTTTKYAEMLDQLEKALLGLTKRDIGIEQYMK